MEEVDVALLQETGQPPAEVADRVRLGPEEHYDSHVWNSRWYEGRWNKLHERWPMVVRLSDRVRVEWFKQVSPISDMAEDEIAVSGIGDIAVARVVPLESETQPFIVVSMYARWIRPHPSTRSKWRVGFSDGSAHRIISDLSAFIGNVDPASHRIIAAGDMNMIFGSKPKDPQSLSDREDTVFNRMDALGFKLMGPWHLQGPPADPQPPDLPPDSRNLRTFRSSRQTPATAQNQLDYVFASRGFHEAVTVSALNEVENWGSSDHCRLQIEVD